MMTTPSELYDLLPAHVRLSDAHAGQPLRALLAVMQRELDELRVEVETIWDDWFIETCEEWLVPYIGELVGVRGMQSSPDGTVPLRAYVAKQLAYRRRKGTVAALEELARDLTGRPARAVELFTLCARTTHTRHLRAELPCNVDLRHTAALARVGSAFEKLAHGADVRSIASRRGRYNVPNVGLFAWPTEVMLVEGGTAARHATIPEAFSFDPLGQDIPLFGAPETEQGIESLAERRHVPRRLTRLDLSREEASGVRADLAAFTLHPPAPPPPPATHWRIEVAHLSTAAGGLPGGRPAPDAIRVDPENGRILFHPASAPAPGTLRVDYAYGTPWRIGAGPFDRSAHWQARWADITRASPPWFRRVTAAALPPDAQVVPDFVSAVAAWNVHLASLTAAERAAAVGVIALGDSRTLDTAGAALELPAGARLYVAALLPPSDAGPSLAADAANGVRPVLRGDLLVHGAPQPGSARLGGALVFDGVTLSGTLTVQSGELERLELAHCSLAQLSPGIRIQAQDAGDPGEGNNAGLVLELFRTRCGGIAGASAAARWHLVDSIVHGTPAALAAPEVELALQGCTVLGSTQARLLEASNTLFHGLVSVAQHQLGCLRYCYVPQDSVTPRRYRCQPDGALSDVAAPELRAQVVARVRPELESLQPAQPGYARLDPSTAPELLRGSEARCEIGAGHHLRWATREANLRTALRQYFRFGLESGLFLEP